MLIKQHSNQFGKIDEFLRPKYRKTHIKGGITIFELEPY